jgi:hypothetical protein
MAASCPVRGLLAVLVASVPLVLPALARPAANDADTARFVAGNVEFVLVHELGHLVIGEFQVPVLGPEEVAADYIAIAALIRREQAGGEWAERARESLFAAASALATTWRRGQEGGAEVPYWGLHALNIQRFYQVGCLVHGSDPEFYADLPVRIGLPPARARGCPAEYALAARSFEWLLQTYGRKPGDASGPVLTIEYLPPRSRAQQRLAELLKADGAIDFTVWRLNELFRLKQPARLILKSCGQPEAAWQATTRELVICYELLETFARLATRAESLAGPAARPR